MDALNATSGATPTSPLRDAVGVPELSIVIPCLNEKRTLGSCIRGAQSAIDHLGISAEIIVADNGSTDGSPSVARELGARLVHVETRGYGSAVRAGIAEARGRYVITGDSDGSHDFAEIGEFVGKLNQGYDLVVGNRFRGEMCPGAMGPLHRYLGNPLLSWLGRLFFKCPVGDFHCGFRGFDKKTIEKLALRTTGFELCTEMVVKATLFHLRIAEVPTNMLPAGRLAPPHLHTWLDGWRNLRFLLLYSPRWLFLYPGIGLLLLGISLGAWLVSGPRTVAGVTFGNGTLLFGAMSVLVGFQSVAFAVYSKVFAISEGLLPEDRRLNRLLRHVTLEVGLAIGMVLLVAGTAAWGFSLGSWGQHHFATMDPGKTLRVVIPGLVAFTLGVQTVLSSFFLSVLGLPRR